MAQLNIADSVLFKIFTQISAYRTATDKVIVKDFSAAWNENNELAMKLLFHTRDILGGKGERKFFRVALNWIADNHPAEFKKNIANVPAFGRWDDLIEATHGTRSFVEVMDFVAKQFALDIQSDKPSLLAKWMPSENTSSASTRALARDLIRILGVSPRAYRKSLSLVRAKLNLVETSMSKAQWTGINYSHVPSRAFHIYRNAFRRHDATRFSAFVDVAANAPKEVREAMGVKVNAATLYPHEIIAKYSGYGSYEIPAKDENVIQAQWNGLPNFVKEGGKKAIVLADTSGSMFGKGRGAAAPIDIAVSLAIYTAERLTGPLQNKFITFESSPKLMDIGEGNIADKFRRVSRAPWGGSTNVGAALDLVLKAAVNAKLPQADVPEVLLIISDMQFNGPFDKNMLERVKKTWTAAGYNPPIVVLWNVNAVFDAKAPVKSFDYGAALISGYSPSVLTQALGGAFKFPYELMLDTLMDERYAAVVV